MNLTHIKTYLFFCFLTAALFQSCKSGQREADTSGIDLSVKVDRFERALFSIKKEEFETEFPKLEKKYPAMTSLILGIMGFDSLNTPEKIAAFKDGLMYNPYVDSTYKAVQAKFTDAKMQQIEGSLTDAFKRLKYFFPKDTIPKVYSFISYFRIYQAYTIGKDVAIPLDKYLGSDYPVYRNMATPQGEQAFPQYMYVRFKEEYILPNVMKVLFNEKFPEEIYTADKTLLSRMIHAGKRLYFLDQTLPDVHDSLKIEYTAAQLLWNEESEDLIWKHIAQSKLLYSADHRKTDPYLAEGKFTSAEGVPNDSPPRIGEWIGWQIVRKYMAENKDVTLQQLLAERDYRKILERAKYKPRGK